jgi:NADPH:quinone reductase
MLGKKLILEKYGETREDAIDNILRLEAEAAPDGASLGPEDVLVGVKSAAVTFVDLLMLSGQYQTMMPLPGVPGIEYSGEVLAVGKDVRPRKLAVGDRVLSDFLITGPRSTGPYSGQGGWQSFAVAPQQGVHRIPGNLSYDAACNLLLNYETAYYALIHRAKLQPRETVLITGASGATGLAGVQVAKILGANVIATGRSDEKLAQVKAAGADHVINTSPAKAGDPIPRFRDEVKALTGGRGVEVVYDAVGGDVSQEALRSLAFEGRLVIVGWAQNTSVAKGGGKRGSDNADRLPTNIIQMKGLHVMGAPTVIHAARDPSIRPPRLNAVMQWAGEGRIAPIVSHRLPISDYRAAMHAKLSGDVTGGCVLHFD